MDKARGELRTVGCELRYTQQTVAGELAGWQDLHVKLARRTFRRFVSGMVVRERERLESLKRTIRGLEQGSGGLKGRER